jgi:FtsH-binding integral membrane protein
MIELPHRAKCPEWMSGRKARMEAENTWVVVWIVLHIAALAVAYGTRVAAGSCVESIAQVLFFAAMLMMGLAIWACQQVHAGAWGLSAVTLIAMVLTAVVDFRKLGEHRSMGQMN